MAVRKVAVMGHPVLRQVAKPVPKEQIQTPAFQQLIRDMIETMYEYDGRGLAAPQVHESLQLIVMIWDFDPKEKPSLLVLVNPEIKPLTKTTSPFWEGCLSLPGLRGEVARPNKISVNALDQTGNAISFEADGFAATVVQHECDHLLGKLYIDRMTDLTRLSFNREYAVFLASDGDATEEGGE